MNWHPGVRGAECWDGVYLCGLPSERPRWVIPRAVFPHSKHMTMGWLSKPLSSICLIWAFCLHLSSAPRLKAVALLLFASLLGSEENDNNEAWRLSTASHTNIHTYTANTDATANADTHTHAHQLTLRYSRHTSMNIYTHMQCEMKTGRHKLLFVPHQVWKYISVVYICNLLRNLHLILYYRALFYILL